MALIGDGALTGGLAYEGLNNAGASGEHMIVILNDNGMSIDPNVGAFAESSCPSCAASLPTTTLKSGIGRSDFWRDAPASPPSTASTIG